MNEVVHTSPTIGSNVEEIVVKNTHFLMWDIGGQESLRSSWNTYYSNTEVRNPSVTASHLSCRAQVLSAFLLSVAAGVCVCVFVQSTDGSRGRPSQRVRVRSPFHKGARLKSKAGVRLLLRRGRIRERQQRQMCGRFEKKAPYRSTSVILCWCNICQMLFFLTSVS